MKVYLDHAATTPADGRVMEAVMRCMRMANPSAAYADAGEARREMRLARQQIARMLGIDHTAVVFTSGGSEANAWAMTASPNAAVSAIEHASVLRAAPGAVLIPANEQGMVTPEAVEKALRPDTKLVSVQWANNETGVLQPVEAIYPIVKKHGALFHVDAVQAFGHVPVSMKHCDLMTLSAHKLYGPRGAGCLVIRPGVRLKPLIPGGGQEKGLRSGTENVPAIAGFGVAAAIAQQEMAAHAQRERALVEDFIRQLRVPGMRLLGADAPRLPGVAAIFLPGMLAEIAIAKLDLRGVMVSGGAACHSHDASASHVYQAMGLTEDEARRVLRVSVGRGSTPEGMAYAARMVNEVYGGV